MNVTVPPLKCLLSNQQLALSPLMRNIRCSSVMFPYQVLEERASRGTSKGCADLRNNKFEDVRHPPCMYWPCGIRHQLFAFFLRSTRWSFFPTSAVYQGWDINCTRVWAPRTFTWNTAWTWVHLHYIVLFMLIMARSVPSQLDVATAQIFRCYNQYCCHVAVPLRS